MIKDNERIQKYTKRLNFIFFLGYCVFIFVNYLKLKLNMPKIIFEINYNIHPEKRGEYLNAINDLRNRIRETSNSNYSVFENKKTQNNFTEIYICENEEEFDSLEDNQSEETIELTQKLFNEFIKDKKVIYTTKYEV